MDGSKSRSKLLVGAVAALVSSVNFASGYYIPDISAVELQQGLAGGAAYANDASINYFNAAGLVRLPEQIVGSGLLGYTRQSFNGTMNDGGVFGFAPTTETGTASSNSLDAVPALHFAMPINDRLAFGLSLTSPFVLGSSYQQSSVTRYDLVWQKLKTIDAGPSLALKFNDHLSVGFGPDLIYYNLNAKVNVRTQPLSLSDSIQTTKLMGYGYGWHGGLLYQFDKGTRVGLGFHSQVIVHLHGASELTVPDDGGFGVPGIPGATRSDSLRSNIPLPPITSLSLYHEVNDRWALMGTLELQYWSVFRTSHIYNAASIGTTADATQPVNYSNTVRYGLGSTFTLRDNLMLRGGVSVDPKAATSNIYRDLSDPDGRTILMSAGIHYQESKKLGIDFGYTYVLPIISKINFTNAATASVLQGTNNAYANILSLQLTYNIG